MKKFAFLFVTFALALTSCGSTSSFNSENSAISSNEITSSSSSSFSVDSDHVHQYSLISETQATLLERGVKTYSCSCGDSYERYSYYLEEIAFKDKVFQYSGHENVITLEGLLPSRLTVEYENNKLTEIGSKEATAKILDEEGQVVMSKKAVITVEAYTGFPHIELDTSGASIDSDEEYTPVKVSTSNCKDAYKISNKTGGIRLRGHGSQTYDKKPYRIKLDKKLNLLGLHSDYKNWVLLADYNDPSMLRNQSALNIGNSLFNYSNNYASRYEHVHVYLNGQYQGVYLLAEQQQINAGRVAINEAEENYQGTDIGYFLELHLKNTDGQQIDADFPDYVSLKGNRRVLSGATVPDHYYEVKSDYYSNDQKTFIQKYINNVFSIMFNAVSNKGFYKLDQNYDLVEANFANAYECINEVIDLESLFKIYYLQEMMCNVDVGYASFYLFVDFSSKSTHKRLTFGAPWDFDWSSGNANKNDAQNAKKEYNSRNFEFMNWWLYMLRKSDFFNTYFEKYFEIFDRVGIMQRVFNDIDYEVATFSQDFANNYSVWKTLGTYIPAYTINANLSFKSQKDGADYLKDWLTQRYTYLSSLFLKSL